MIDLVFAFRMTEKNHSHLENPVYTTSASASVSGQQVAQQSHSYHYEPNANPYLLEDNHDYEMPEEPSQRNNGYHEGYSEDSISVQSYEVPVNQTQENNRRME